MAKRIDAKDGKEQAEAGSGLNRREALKRALGLAFAAVPGVVLAVAWRNAAARSSSDDAEADPLQLEYTPAPAPSSDPAPAPSVGDAGARRPRKSPRRPRKLPRRPRKLPRPAPAPSSDPAPGPYGGEPHNH